MTSTTLPLSRGHVAFREAGQGAPLVLIHGVGMDARAWQPQIDALRHNHRVIAIDLPGHGGSSPLPRGSDLKGFVAWLKDVATALQLERFSLAGHSMGALIAAGFACTYPNALSRVALLNPVFRRNADARTAVQARADEIARGSFDVETPLKRWFGDSDIDLAAKALTGQILSEVGSGGYATAYAAFAAGDATYADKLADITCPFLALTGDGDLNSTPEMSREMAEAVPNGRAVIIKGHRHMVNLTAPEAVNAALSDWLAVAATEEALPWAG